MIDKKSGVWKTATLIKKRHSFEFSHQNVTAICKAFLDNIKPLSSHAKDEPTATPTQSATPKPQSNPSAAINSILSNIRPQAGATKSTPQPSADDKIRNILANARNKK